MYGVKKGACRVLLRKPAGKSPAGKPRRRRGNVIHKDMKVRVWECIKKLIYSGWGQTVGCYKYGEEYSGRRTRGKLLQQLRP
jgi:hypothetical protein